MPPRELFRYLCMPNGNGNAVSIRRNLWHRQLLPIYDWLATSPTWFAFRLRTNIELDWMRKEGWIPLSMLLKFEGQHSFGAKQSYWWLMCSRPGRMLPVVPRRY